MAQTQDQWFDKIKKFVPAWWFEQNKYNVALFRAIAAIFTQIDEDNKDQFDTTYILKATYPLLDLLGDERGIDRLPGESNQLYQTRIQRITSQTDVASIKAVIDSLLLVPGCVIRESPGDNPYCNRLSFCSRNTFISGFIQNFFTIIVPLQVHAPYSFASRGTYANRLNFVGTNDATSDYFNSIIAIVNYMKAFGVMYRLVESTSSVIV